MESSRNILILKDSRGIEHEFRVLFNVQLEDKNKNYIAFTDDKKDSEGNIKVTAAIYNPEIKDKLIPIEDDKELRLIESILNSIKVKNEEENK